MWPGVTDGTVVTVAVSDAAADLWQQMKEQAEQFYKLGYAGGGSVGGQRYTEQECYIKTIEINDQHANAWDCLGYFGGGSVGGQQYTQRQCYDKANEIRAAA